MKRSKRALPETEFRWCDGSRRSGGNRREALDSNAVVDHLAEIESTERIAWHKSSGYNHRSRGETLIGHWKTVIRSKLQARAFNNQKTEAKVGVRVLNRMTELSRPNFECTA
jgi:hypothetical protein